MAEEFEVRGVHEHVLDHAAEHGGPDSFAGRIAVMTAILSTAGAIFGYQGGATQNEALLLKNEAAIHKTEASNQWAYYQAKSQKQAIAELAGQLPGVDHEAAKREAQRYGTEKEQIRQTAKPMSAPPARPTRRARWRCTTTTAGRRPWWPSRSPSRWRLSRC